MAEPDGADAINIDIGEEGYVDGRDLQLEVTSYCVYLGGISEPPSAEQQRVLNEFDLLIVDPANVPLSFKDYRSKLTLAKVSLESFHDNILSEYAEAFHGFEKSSSIRHARALFKETEFPSLLSTKVCIEDGRLDGIYISEVEIIHNSYGMDLTERVLTKLIDLFCHEEEKQPLIFIEGGHCFASSSLASFINGVLITNPTLKPDGKYHLLNWGSRWAGIKSVINQAKVQMNQRLDFVALAMEVIEVPAAKTGWGTARFVKFCKTYKLVGWLSGDPTFSNVEETHQLPVKASGAMGLFTHRLTKAFISSFEHNRETPGEEIDFDTSEKVVFAELQQIADVLGIEFNTERYTDIWNQIRNEYDDDCLDLGSYLWLGMFSRFHREVSAKDSEDLKWDVVDLSQTHKSRRVAQLLRFLVSSELGRISQARRKKSMKFVTLPINHNLGDDVVKKDDYMASKWSGEGTGTPGQREIGYYFRPDEYQRVVDVQERLRQKNLLRDLSTREGSAAHEPILDEAITKIDDVILNPEKHATVLKAFLKNGEDIGHCQILEQLKELRNGLDTFSPHSKGYRSVQVWECDPIGLTLHGHGYLSVSRFHETNKILHIYTSRYHPNLAEALVHCYFQMVGFPHTMCVLLELLVKTVKESPTPATKFWDSLDTLPDRVVHQIKNSSYEELAWFVHQTQKVHQEIKVQSMQERQRYIAGQMANQIRSAAKYLLLDDIQIRNQTLAQNLSILNGTSDFPASPLKDFDNRLKSVLVELVDKASWHEPSYCILTNLLEILNRGFSLGFLSAQSGPIKLFYDVLINIGRRNALDELEIQIRDSNAYVLGERDLITVYLEFNGLTEEDSQRYFGISKFELGGFLYDRIREKMEFENPEVVEFECPKGSYDISANDMLSGKSYVHNWLNGIFFMFFMLVNFVLVLTTGVGLYTSKYTTHPQVVAWAIILSFITAGPLNGAIARLGSMYVYQWSFSLAFVMLTRLIVCGIVLSCSFLVIIGPILFLTIDTFAALLFVVYYSVFVTMLVFISAISSLFLFAFYLIAFDYVYTYTMHKNSIWTSSAGFAILAAEFADILVVFLLFEVVGLKEGTIVHVLGLFACCGILILGFFSIAHQFTVCLKNIQSTSERDVLLWAFKGEETKVPPGSSAPEDVLIQWYCSMNPEIERRGHISDKQLVRRAKKELRQAEDQARLQFTKAVELEKARWWRILGVRSNDPLIYQRAINYKFEELLLNWYILLTNKARPTPCSKEWDNLIDEAKDAYQTKTKTDTVIRGGLLWDIIKPYAFQGMFYYILLFGDRFTMILVQTIGRSVGQNAMSSLQGLNWFLPSSPYELASGWALVCLLLAMGCLEGVPLRMQSIDKQIQYRFGNETYEEMMKQRSRIFLRFYWGTALWIGCVCASCGLVCGVALASYTALFLSSCIGFVARALLYGAIFGIASGAIVWVFADNVDVCCTAIGVGGWVYFGLNYVKFRKICRQTSQSLSQEQVGGMQSPAFMTSGQRFIASDTAKNIAGETKAELIDHLKSASCAVLTTQTELGAEVAGIMKLARERWIALPDDCLLKVAFPRADEIIDDILAQWESDKIVIHILEESDLKLTEDEGFSAFSIFEVSKPRVPIQSPSEMIINLNVDSVLDPGLRRSALDSSQSIEYMDIFVGLSEEESSQRIAEALVHEYYENFLGNSHRIAVVSELLVAPEWGVVHVPARIMSQLASASRTFLLRVADGTDNKIFELMCASVCGGLNHSSEETRTPESPPEQEWEELSMAARCVGVSVMQYNAWSVVRPCTHQAPTLETLCQSVGIDPDEFEQGVRELQRSLWPTVISWTEYVSAMVLSVQLVLAIKRACVEICTSRAAYAPSPTKAPPQSPRPLTRDLIHQIKENTSNPRLSVRILRKVDGFLRLAFLAFTADSTFAQEWTYAHSNSSDKGGLDIVGRFFSFGLLLIHNLTRVFATTVIFFVVKTRQDIAWFSKHMSRGVYGTQLVERNLVKRIQYKNPSFTPQTGFIHYDASVSSSYSITSHTNSPIEMHIYPQVLEREPDHYRGKSATVVYENGSVARLIEYAPGGDVTHLSLFEYSEEKKSKIPSRKLVFGGSRVPAEFIRAPPVVIARELAFVSVVDYDKYGRPASTDFQRSYQAIQATITASYKYPDNTPDAEPFEVVYEHVPEIDRETQLVKISVRYHNYTNRVMYADYQKDNNETILRTFFTYKNVKHMHCVTFKVGSDGQILDERFVTPNLIKDDPFNLLHVARVKTLCNDVLVTDFPIPWFYRLFKFSGVKNLALGKPYSTLKSRILLWKAWQAGTIEGSIALLWDDAILRSEPMLRNYWWFRDWGLGEVAKNNLRENLSQIIPLVHPEASHPDLRAHFLVKPADLMALVPGGYSHEIISEDSVNNHVNGNSTKLFRAFEDSTARLDVVGLDSGTWPADGGGVGSCRRDLVDRLNSVYWTQLSEIGNPMKLTIYQTDRNVRNMFLIPLWGEFMGEPCEYILTDVAYGKIALRKWATTAKSVYRFFVPIIQQLVVACTTIQKPTMIQMQEWTSLFVNMYGYFQEYDWVATWCHPIVVAYWRKTWCEIYSTPESCAFLKNKYLEIEKPTLRDLDALLSLFAHFLFPITVPLPPHPVYHSTHHGLQAVLGVIASNLYGSSLIIWDHGMLWREKIKALSEIDFFSGFIKNGLVGLQRAVLRTNFSNSTIVASCCTRGNPEWEKWLGGFGTGPNSRHTIAMARRMSPILNGMETDKFKPDFSQEDRNPTSILLSHVYDLKDIKNAIMAASIIVNVFKITSYQMLVYGSTTKDLDYVAECRDLIAGDGLSGNVHLMGLGNAPKVLPRGWLFLNSSQSEGLPLALGEAGLAGLPVVCTDVGGSREVVSDGEIIFGRVVPPRNPMALARAQLEVFAMLGPDEELESFQPLSPQGPNLEERMQGMKVQRRELGMMFRQYIQDNFGIECYLKRHEQQLWIGTSRCAERRALAQALKDGEVGAHKWSSLPFRHFRYEELEEVAKDYECLDIQDPSLIALYADASFRMNQAAMKKKYRSFLHELAKTSYNASGRHSPPPAARSGIRSLIDQRIFRNNSSNVPPNNQKGSYIINSKGKEPIKNGILKVNNSRHMQNDPSNGSLNNYGGAASASVSSNSSNSSYYNNNNNNNNNSNYMSNGHNNSSMNISQDRMNTSTTDPNSSMASQRQKGKTASLLHHSISRLIYQFTSDGK